MIVRSRIYGINFLDWDKASKTAAAQIENIMVSKIFLIHATNLNIIKDRFSDISPFGEVPLLTFQLWVWIGADMAMQISWFPRLFTFCKLFARMIKICTIISDICARWKSQHDIGADMECIRSSPDGSTSSRWNGFALTGWGTDRLYCILGDLVIPL